MKVFSNRFYYWLLIAGFIFFALGLYVYATLKLNSVISNQFQPIIELHLADSYLVGTDGACLAAAMKIEWLTRNGAIVRLTNNDAWYPFMGKKLIDHRYVSRIIASNNPY